jgi:hypothetical protein
MLWTQHDVKVHSFQVGLFHENRTEIGQVLMRYGLDGMSDGLAVESVGQVLYSTLDLKILSYEKLT